MKHHLKFRMPAVQVQYSDVTIEVSTTDTKDSDSKPRKMGELRVSKGNIEWIPRDHSTTRYQMSWTTFAETITNNGKKVTGKKK